MLDVRPVSLDQIEVARNGREYLVTGEAGRIAKQLRDLDPTLTVTFEEAGLFFVIVQTVPTGPKKGKATCVDRIQMGDWDERVIRKWEARAHELRNGLDIAARMDAEQDERKAGIEYRLRQELEAGAEPLMHAIQKSMGSKPRAFFPARKSPLAAAA